MFSTLRGKDCPAACRTQPAQCPRSFLCYFLPHRMTSAQERKIRQTGCDARFDNLTRQLYSTDASIYQIHPVGAAFPKTAKQASLVIHAPADAGLSITPR